MVDEIIDKNLLVKNLGTRASNGLILQSDNQYRK